MALQLVNNIDAETLLAIWKIEESIDCLLSIVDLNIVEKAAFDKMISDKRKKEWLSVRAILKEQNRTDCISYTSDGRPYLKSEKHISISHSNDFAVLLSSDKRCGVDIEKITDRIVRLKNKFLSKMEIENINEADKLCHLYMHWSAKEAAVKLYGKKSFIFDKELQIEKFQPKDKGSFNLIVNDDEIHDELKIDYQKFEDHILVWIIEN